MARQQKLARRPRLRCRECDGGGRMVYSCSFTDPCPLRMTHGPHATHLSTKTCTACGGEGVVEG